jgi:uncharacterized protein (TIGR01244 family)
MNVQHYKDTIYITGQVLPEDIMALIKDYGFSVIVNNRIDGEEDSQPESKTLEAVCKDAAVEYYYLPMRHRGDIPDEYLKARDELLRTHQNEKILFFCRTGGRSEALLNQA